MRRSADRAAGSEQREASEREAPATIAIADHAGEDPDQHTEHVERGDDERGLDERKVELRAQRRQHRRHLGHVGAGHQAAAEDGPDTAPWAGGAGGLLPAPARHAALTGSFSSTILRDHSAGPVLCSDSPFASTATVTGMSRTSNS